VLIIADPGLVGDFKKIRIWDLDKNECVEEILLLAQSLSLGWMCGGSMLLALLSNGSINLYSFTHSSTSLIRHRMVPGHTMANGNLFARGAIATHTSSGKFATCCSEDIRIWKVKG
jgi:hypothetical protein